LTAKLPDFSGSFFRLAVGRAPVCDGGYGCERQATGNREQGTGNRVQETGDRVQGTGNRGQGTGDRVQVTGCSALLGCEGEQGLKPAFKISSLAARLKPCPCYKTLLDIVSRCCSRWVVGRRSLTERRLTCLAELQAAFLVRPAWLGCRAAFLVRSLWLGYGLTFSSDWLVGLRVYFFSSGAGVRAPGKIPSSGSRRFCSASGSGNGLRGIIWSRSAAL
jgi:hypothetical protein